MLDVTTNAWALTVGARSPSCSRPNACALLGLRHLQEDGVPEISMTTSLVVIGVVLAGPVATGPRRLPARSPSDDGARRDPPPEPR